MSYTITDIAELVRYHLVLAEPDDTRPDDNLVHPVERTTEYGDPVLCGRRRLGSSAIGAGARLMPTASTRTATAIPKLVTSNVPTAGNPTKSRHPSPGCAADSRREPLCGFPAVRKALLNERCRLLRQLAQLVRVQHSPTHGGSRLTVEIQLLDQGKDL